jgi:hypothetical protein
MNRPHYLYLAIAALMAFGALAAPARPVANAGKVVTEVTAADLRSLLNDRKISFEEALDPEENTMFVLKLAKYKVVLYQYGGEGDKGTSLLLSGVWDTGDEVPLARVNEWNYHQRFTKAYVDDGGELHMEADLDLEGGVTIGAIAKWIADFEKQMPEFLEAFGIE